MQETGVEERTGLKGLYIRRKEETNRIFRNTLVKNVINEVPRKAKG